MQQIYSIKDAAQFFDIQPSQLRYWTQTGFVAPTVRKQGRLFYTFRDLIGIRVAKDLLAAGQNMDEARPKLELLRKKLPAKLAPTDDLQVSCDGSTVDVHKIGEKPTPHPVMVAFTVSSLAQHIRGESNAAVVEAVPEPITGEQTTPHIQPNAYSCFKSGFTAEAEGDWELAEDWYGRAIELEPSMSAASTNLGNILYRLGNVDRARELYIHSLEYEPHQAEARFNLANVFSELGDHQKAIDSLRQVVGRWPDFADAHYNLGVALLGIGGVSQAKTHLRRYLELDFDSEWADKAREYLKACEAN